MPEPTHRHDTAHRGLVPIDQLASGSPSPGDVPTFASGTTAEWAPAGGGPGGSVATDAIWDAAGDLAVGTGADTAGRLAITVPAAAILEVLGVVNGETTPTWKAVHDGTAPVTQAFGDVAAAGTALTAAHRDHVHGMPANPGGVTTAQVAARVALGV